MRKIIIVLCYIPVFIGFLACSKQVVDKSSLAPIPQENVQLTTLSNIEYLSAYTTNVRISGIMTILPSVSLVGNSLPADMTTEYSIRTSSQDTSAIRILGGTLNSNNRIYSAIIYSRGGNAGTNDGKHCSGWRADIIANASIITFKVLPSIYKYRFIVDGHYINTSGFQTVNSTGPDEYVRLDFTRAGGKKARHIILEGQVDGGISAVYVNQGGSCNRPVDKVKVTAAYLGDSYVYGLGASFACNNLVWVMADYLGIADMLASGSGGTGWATPGPNYRFDQRLNDIINYNPDVVFIMASINDRFRDTTTTTDHVYKSVMSIRAALPKAPIFIFGALPGAMTSKVVINTENAVKKAITALGLPYTYFIPISTNVEPWVDGTGYQGKPSGNGNSAIYTGTDGIHPNDVGYFYIGKKEADAVLAIINRQIRHP